MKAKPPDIRRKFSHPWDEIGYLYQQMLYWYFQKNDRARAARWSSRLGALLAKHDPTCEAILGAASRSLIAEVAGDLWSAIRARQRELELIDLLAASDAPDEVKYAADDVSDRMDLLAGLYWDAGDLKAAEETLLASKRYCAEHHIPFDGRDMLRELKQDKGASREARAPAKRAS